MAKFELIPSRTAVDDTHSFADRTGRFALDQLLRKHGYRIVSRRKREEPIWMKDGDRMSQSEALDRLGRDEVWTAEYTEYCERDD